MRGGSNRRGFFGLPRKGGDTADGSQSNITVFVFVFLFIVSSLLLLLSSRSFINDVQNAGLSIFSGVRGGIYELTSFVSRSVSSIKELSNLRKEHADL